MHFRCNFHLFELNFSWIWGGRRLRCHFHQFGWQTPIQFNHRIFAMFQWPTGAALPSISVPFPPNFWPTSARFLGAHFPSNFHEICRPFWGSSSWLETLLKHYQRQGTSWELNRSSCYFRWRFVVAAACQHSSSSFLFFCGCCCCCCCQEVQGRGI